MTFLFLYPSSYCLNRFNMGIYIFLGPSRCKLGEECHQKYYFELRQFCILFTGCEERASVFRSTVTTTASQIWTHQHQTLAGVVATAVCPVVATTPTTATTTALKHMKLVS